MIGIALVALATTLVCASDVVADTEKDHQAIRALFAKEQEGHRMGNEEVVRNSHWEDFYVVHTPNRNNVPRYMLSSVYLGEDYLSSFDYEPMPDSDDEGFFSEINHISVNGDVALAVAQFHYWSPEGEGGHQTMWIAEKRDGVWKWKSAIIGFEQFRVVNTSQEEAESE